MDIRSYETFSNSMKVLSLKSACTSSYFELDHKVSEPKSSS
jgi:hypothetical protein